MKIERRIQGFASIGFIIIWMDLCLGHLLGESDHLVRLLPVILLPNISAIAFWALLKPSNKTRIMFLYACTAAILLGLLGFVFHLLSITGKIDSVLQWEVLIRYLRYPPIFAPLSLTALGILGFISENLDNNINGNS